MSAPSAPDGIPPVAPKPPTQPATQRAHTSPFTAARRRLILTNFLFVAVALLGVALLIYAFAARAVDEQVNQELISASQHEAPSVLEKLHEHDTSDSDPPYSPGSANAFAITVDTSGAVAVDEDHAAQQGLLDRTATRDVLAGKSAALFTTLTHDNHIIRLYTIPIANEHGQRVAALQVGVSLDAYTQQLNELRLALGAVIIGVLLITALSSVYVTDRALLPARKAFAQQRQFSAAASHELRTPIALIRSQAELASGLLLDYEQRERDQQPPQIAGSLADIRSEIGEIVGESGYMSRLVEELLLLARNEADPRNLALAPLDLQALAATVVAKMRPLAQEQDVMLALSDSEHAAPTQHSEADRDDTDKADISGSRQPRQRPSRSEPATAPVVVRGDADRLRQLLLILLENALRYTPRGGSVRVMVRRTPHGWEHGLPGRHSEQAMLSVEDTGVGIAPEHLPNLFEPFYRAAPGPATESGSAAVHSGGTGLGLAVADWIARAHGGAITVTSAPGKGSVFTVTLPLASAPANAATPAPTAS